MTDISSAGGPADTPGNRALIAQTRFEKTAIWLPQYAVLHFNAGVHVIQDKVYEECLFEGPGVIMALSGVEFENCNLGVAADPKSLLMRPVGPKVVGAVAFERCRFVRCRFAMISFTGHEPFMAEFEQLQSRGGGQ